MNGGIEQHQIAFPLYDLVHPQSIISLHATYAVFSWKPSQIFLKELNHVCVVEEAIDSDD